MSQEVRHAHLSQTFVLRVHVQLVAVQLGQLGVGGLDVVQVLHSLPEGGEHFPPMGADLGVASDGSGAGEVAEGGKEPLDIINIPQWHLLLVHHGGGGVCSSWQENQNQNQSVCLQRGPLVPFICCWPLLPMPRRTGEGLEHSQGGCVMKLRKKKSIYCSFCHSNEE
uniref:Uncharacterized protein n=1 Tax=Nothoprocta perdicaria TaxID=30464 RepID=A0A8C6ZLV8_NOTPE